MFLYPQTRTTHYLHGCTTEANESPSFYNFSYVILIFCSLLVRLHIVNSNQYFYQDVFLFSHEEPNHTFAHFLWQCVRSFCKSVRNCIDYGNYGSYILIMFPMYNTTTPHLRKIQNFKCRELVKNTFNTLSMKSLN